MSTTSVSHLNYLLPWARDIPNATIFSIDYQLSPEVQFPTAIDDCWQAYTWIVLNAKKAFGINYKKIILTGDSAGGSLVISICLMAIMRKFRIPDSMMPLYPNSIASCEVFWPSLLNSFDDVILSYTLLNLIQKSYNPPAGPHKFIGSKSMYMSPGLCAPDSALSQFPPTRLYLSGVDPLKDDGLNFLLRLLKNGVNVKAYDLRLMPHGFMNYKLPIVGMDEAEKATEITGKCLYAMANDE